MPQKIKIIVYPVKDIAKAKAFYGKFLQMDPYVDSPYYVGYRNEDQEVGLDPNSSLGPIGYIDVEDINASIDEMKKVGAEIIQDPTDVSGGLLIAKMKDPDGNIVGLRQQS